MSLVFGKPMDQCDPRNVDNLLVGRPRGSTPITKYCSDTAYKSLLRGELWLGTNRLFSNPDPANALMTDFDEGHAIIGMPASHGEKIRVGNIQMSNNWSYSMEPGAFGIGIGRRVNYYLFCASCGAYDRNHHETFVDGDAAYKGNPKYDNYIVFDALWLARAIADRVSEMLGECALMMQPCGYNEREEALIALDSEFEHRATRIAIFSKPERFAFEREFRIAIELMDASVAAAGKHLPVISQAIVESIIDRGGKLSRSAPK